MRQFTFSQHANVRIGSSRDCRHSARSGRSDVYHKLTVFSKPSYTSALGKVIGISGEIGSGSVVAQCAQPAFRSEFVSSEIPTQADIVTTIRFQASTVRRFGVTSAVTFFIRVSVLTHATQFVCKHNGGSSMALEGLSEGEITAREEQLLGRVPEIETVGNVTLRSHMTLLGWDEDTYWAIRNRLIERGVLQTGRGKGGSVRRVVAPATVVPAAAVPAQADPAPIPLPKPAERDLYAPMADVIRHSWAQDNRLDSHIVEITAQQGARPTGGRWTRPDITLASYKTFAYVPGKHFDLITFEIKPHDSLDVTVIYEALAHRRAATRSYALVHLPENKQAELQAVLDEVASEAKRFGVGLIAASDPSDYDTWEELVEAVRHEPDPERLNDFLAQQVSQVFREQIVRWFR